MKTKYFCAVFFTAILFFTGCQKEPANDFSISEITISNIPRTFTVKDNDAIILTTHKVYVYASDGMTNQTRAAAKGVIEVKPDMLQSNDTYTVTIQMGKVSPYFKEHGTTPKGPYDPNPNLDHGLWSGEARFFTIAICPQDASVHGENAIWMKGNYDFNVTKKNWNWLNPMNFRENTPGMGFPRKTWEFFHDNICYDPDIITHLTDNTCDVDTSPSTPYP